MNDQSNLIPLKLIDPNPYQVRLSEDPAAVAEIAASILRVGLIHPPTARKLKDSYQLAEGHTRLAAYSWLSLNGHPEYQDMPLIIRDLTDLEMFEIAVSENIKRRNLNPIEQATAMLVYMEGFGKTSEETGEFFGVAPETVRTKIRLLNLAPEIQLKIRAGELNESDGRKLLAVQRVAPKEVIEIGKMNGPGMAGTLDDQLQDAVRGNKAAVEMWGRYHDAEDGKARGGDDLWPLDWKHKGLPTLTQDEALKVMDKRFAQLNTEEGVQFQALREVLAAGMQVIPENYPKLTAEFVEAVAHLSNPPVCTACALHAVLDGAHWCGDRRCWDRKKTAWLAKELKTISKTTGIPTYELATDGKIVRTYDTTYGDQGEAFKRLVSKKDPDLRLAIRHLNQYNKYPTTGSHWIAVVDISKKRLEAKKAQQAKTREENAENRKSEQEQQIRYEQERKNQNASQAFVKKVAVPLFAPAFEGFKNVPAILALIQENGKPGFAKLSRTGKIKALQVRMAELALFHNLNWQLSEKGPTATAKYLQGVAITWGIKLPKDWLDQAKEYEVSEEKAEK